MVNFTMMPSTAEFLLQGLVRQNLITSRMTTFRVEKYPRPVAHADVKEAFRVLQRESGLPVKCIEIVGSRDMIDVWCHEKLFDMLFKVLFANQQLFPQPQSPIMRDDRGTLPTLFVSSEKTQIRQIPIAETRPWPFKFLLELGGMIVCRSTNRRDMLLELRQFMRNHPQYEIRVDAKEWPDGSVAIFTWWFRGLSRLESKENMNVPS